MNLLARREHSRQELLQKLSRRSYETDEIEQAVDQLAEEGLQSDLRFTESFTRQRAGNGYGPVRIRYELQQRGISASMTDQALVGYVDTWLDSARELQQRKFGSLPSDYAARAKQQRFLQNRGFDFDVIKRVFSE